MQKSITQETRRFPVFLPLSKVSVIWQFFVILFLIVSFVVTVMVQCFESYYNVHDILYYGFDNAMIPIMLIDILITFNTCYVKNGVVIYDRSLIATKYVRSVHFWVDLACFIISILQVALNTQTNYQTAFNFIIFIKVIKMYSFDQNIKKYGLKSFNSLLIYEIVKNIVFLSLICYTLGAFFYLIDYNLYQNMTYPMSGPNRNPYWIIGSSSYPMIIDQNLWVKVTYCYYYTIVLLSGVAYGDLVPQNPVQTLYTTLLLFFPLVIYSYVFNAIYSIISKKRQRNKLIRKYQFITTRYLKNLKVKKTLQTKLITYLTFIFKKTAHNTQFLNSLAPSVRKQYLTHNIRAKFDMLVFEQMLQVSPFTNRSKFEDQMIELIKEEAFPERYKLILPPDRFKLYYINQGMCKRVAINFPAKLSDDFTRGQYFGYYPFLTGIYNYNLSYESANFVVVQSVDRFAFLQLLKKRQFEQLKEAYFMMREQKLMYDNETIDGYSAHMLERCHHLRPNINYHRVKKISLSRQYFAKFGAKEKRYSRKKFKPKKVVLDQCPIMIKEQLPSFSSVQVQCDYESLLNQRLAKRWYTGKSAFFSVYYPQHNLETFSDQNVYGNI